MRLLELYDPLFQYLCQVNRLARNGVRLTFLEVRGQVLGLLAEVDAKASGDVRLRDGTQKLKAPVLYFIDDWIAQSPLPFAKQWHDERLGYEKDGLAGDEAFFDLLDKALKLPPTQETAEELLVYYTCIGLGFQGFYFNQPDRLREYMRALHVAVRPFTVEDTVPHLIPPAYEVTDRRDFARPPAPKSLLVVLGTICLLLAGIPIYGWLAENVLKEAPEEVNQIYLSHQGSEESLSGKTSKVESSNTEENE